MKGAEEDYLELEKKLDEQIRQMESTHPGYDEYRYQLDEIGHDPYQLISHLTAVYEQFTRGQVKPVIKSLFEQQYNCGNGWNVGRTTANGLRGKCSYVSPANAQPGDLIFFEKTYNTVGASHVGIYVGNGMMIHCGDPISYTSINSTYWQNHFLGFGRIRYH